MAQAKLLPASISRQHSGGFSVAVQAEVVDWHSDSKTPRKRTKKSCHCGFLRPDGSFQLKKKQFRKEKVLYIV